MSKIKKLGFVILLIFLSCPRYGHSQATVFALLKKPRTLANENFKIGAYADAIKLYRRLLNKNPGDASLQLRLAQSYYHVKDYPKSISLYDSYLKHNNAAFPLSDMFFYAEAQAAVSNNGAALEYYEQYLERDPDNELVAKKIWRINNIKYLYEDSSRYAIKPLEINTSFGDLNAVPLNDGIVFTSNRRTIKAVERVDRKLNEPFYQLYSAEWKKDLTVRNGYVIGEPGVFAGTLHSSFNTGPVAFFNKGTQMAFVASSQEPDKNGERKLGVYFASLVDSRWQPGLAFSYNSDDYSISDVTINESGTSIFFSSDMKGGIGGKDIYTSQLKDGRWSKPTNLGETVNTAHDEIFPYLDREGSLYFSSDGHPGLGQLDIFKVEVRPGGFGEPQNVGYPLNSSYDDFGLSLDSLGTHGYLSSNRKNGGYDDDLFEFDMDLQKYPLTISGIVKYKEHTWSDQSAIHAWPKVKIALIDSWNGRSAFETAADANGNFSVTIPYFSKYFLQIIDESGNEHKVSFEIMKYRTEVSNREIVVVKDIFTQKEEQK